jgi:twitching motility protein PilI
MVTRAARSLFELLGDFERRSVAHDVSSASQRDGETTWDGVVFRLGAHRLTVGITEVEEILPMPQITPVPGSKEWLLGMANVRGNLVTVVDLGWFLTGTRTPITARTRLILTRLQGRHLGLIVDEVFGQRHFNVADVVDESIDDEALAGLVERYFPQGEERWGRFRIGDLMTRGAFLDGSAA